MSQTLASILACVQTVHSFFFYESYDLKAEGNKHWNSQKQAKNIFPSYTMYTIFHEKK